MLVFCPETLADHANFEWFLWRDHGQVGWSSLVKLAIVVCMEGKKTLLQPLYSLFRNGNVETLSFLKWGNYSALPCVINQHLHVSAVA